VTWVLRAALQRTSLSPRSASSKAVNDVLAVMTFPKAHWTQIYSTNPLERLNAEVKRQTNVVGTVSAVPG